MMKSIATTDRRKHTQMFSLNLIRAVAIMLVLVDHSMMTDMSEGLRYLVSLIVNPDAVLFFMVSGALLMPVGGSYGHFIRHRVMRVFVPFVVWVIIYALAYYWLGLLNDYSLAMQIRWSWMWFNFPPGWFVPAIMSLYLLMPLLSPWVATASRRQFHYVLVIWLVSGLMPFFAGLGGVDLGSTPLGLFMTAIPYAIMGYYITKYRYRQPLLPAYVVADPGDGERMATVRRRTRLRKLVVLYAVLLSVGILFPLLLRSVVHTFDYRSACLLWTGLPAIAMALLYYSTLVKVRTLGARCDKVVNFLARYSYGLYLSHWLLGRILLPRYAPEYAGNTVVVFAVMFMGGLAVTALLRRVPFVGRYVV